MKPPHSFIALSVAFAVLVAAFAFSAPAEAQSDTYVDLSVEITVTGRDHTFTARNNGTAIAYGVTVDIELADQVIRSASTQFKQKSGTTCSGNIPTATTTSTCISGVWTVGALEPGEEAEIAIRPRLASGLPCCSALNDEWTVPARAEISNTVPGEEERFKGDNTDVGWIQTTQSSDVNNRAPRGQYWLEEATVDDLLPDPGDTVKFSFQVRTPGGAIDSVYGAKLRLKLDDGMGTPTSTTTPPTGSTFAAAMGLTRTWDWDFDLEDPTSTRNLVVSTTLDNPLPGGVARSDLCLTAELTAERPDSIGVVGRVTYTSAEICLTEDPDVLLQEGEATLFSIHPCVGVTTYPCSSDDTLEMRVVGGSAARAAGIDRDEAVLHPERVFVHVKDPDGRRIDTHSDSVNSGTAPSWHTLRPAHRNLQGGGVGGVDVRYSLLAFASGERENYIDNSLDLSASVAGLGTSTAPGLVNIRYSSSFPSAEIKLNPSGSATFVWFPTSSTDLSGAFSRFVEFSTLGTYKLDYIAAVTHNNGTATTTDDVEYSGTGNYTFHVGPIAELQVRDGGANPGVRSDQRAFTIFALNNGPDDAPAVQVTVTGLNTSDYVSHTATKGAFATSTGVWDIGEMREPVYQQGINRRDGETLTIITSGAATSTVTASITNTQDYSVCIDSDANDYDAADQAACTATTTRSWHTAKYYDYISDNNNATSTARAGTGAHLPALRTPGPHTAAISLEWEAVDTVLNWPVTHYEVRPSDPPCQVPPPGATGTKVAGTTHVDVGVEPGDEKCYHVRAVNAQLVAGPWSAPQTATATTAMPPGKPTGLTPTVSNVSDIMLEWTAATSGPAVARYEVEYSADGISDWRPLANRLTATTTSYTDTGAGYGETRHYRVRAVSAEEVDGDWSDSQFATTGNPAPGVPTSVSAVARGLTGIIVWWLPPGFYQGDPVTHYELEVSEDGVTNWTTLDDDLAGTSYNHGGLSGGDTRHYRVYAHNDAGRSDPSGVGSATTPSEATGATAGPPEAPLLTATPNGRTEITLNWQKPIENGASITSYTLEVAERSNGPWAAPDPAPQLGGSDTSWSHTGLTGGARRYYRMKATNSEGDSDWSAVIDATTRAPGQSGPPTRVSAVPDGDSAIDVSWLAPADDGGTPITRYDVQWSADGEGSWRGAGRTDDGDTLTLKHTGLSFGTTRYYRVAARNARGLSVWSEPPYASATTLAGVPGRPNLTARATDANTIELSWNTPANNGSAIIRFELEWSADGSPNSWTNLTNPGATDTSYDDSGLSPGTERHYRIRAVNGASPGEGSWSATRSAVTPPAVPGVPTLRAEANGQNAIDIIWEPPFDDGGADITSYELHWSADGAENSYRRLTSPSGTARSYTHTNLQPDTTRYYQLRARNRSGLGEFSFSASATTLKDVPAAPTLTARANGASEIKLSWTKPDDRGSDIFIYHLQQSDDGNDWYYVDGNFYENDTEYVHTGLTGGTTKYYRIRAGNLNGDGQWSATRSARTDAGGPDAPVLTLTSVDDNTIRLDWTVPANNGSSIRGYWVERSVDGDEPWERLTGSNRTTTYNDDDLYRGMTRHYRVAAFNGAGTGPYSGVKSETTTGDPATAPGEPTLVRLSSVSRNQVTLAWDPPTDDGGAPVSGYEYEVARPCEDDPNTPDDESEYHCSFTGEDVRETTGTSARITGLTTDGDYDFRVRAVNLVGKGEWVQGLQTTLRPSTSAQVRVSPSSITVNEGATTTYTIRLSTAPPHPVSAYVQPQGNGGYNDIEEAAFEYNESLLTPSGWTHPDPDQVEFWREFSYSWNQGVRVTIHAPEDIDTDDEVALMYHFVHPLPYDHYRPCEGEGISNKQQCRDDWDAAWANSPYRQLTGASVIVRVRDND